MLKKNRRFWQANMCQMSLSLMMATTIENAVIVVHSPIGCGSNMNGLGAASSMGKARRGKKPETTVWLSTNLQEADVISGGEEKLRRTIIYADKEFRPEIIFVVATCTPAIIGDDIEEVVRSVGEGTSAIVTAIHCPGFKSRVVASAYDSFYHSVLRRIPLEPIPYEDYTPVEQSDPDYLTNIRRFNAQKRLTVNIFNATSIGPDDEAELKRLLNAIGINVRFFAEYCSLKELRMVSFAGLNVSMCNLHDDYIVTYLREKYDIPYIIADMPIGFAATANWILAIADHYNLADKAKSLIDQEERELRKALEPLLPQIKGKRVLICGGVIRSGTEALALKELGVDMVGVRAYHYDNNADEVFTQLAEEFPDLTVAISNQPFEMINQLRKLKPDVVISHNGTNGWLSRAGFTSIQLFDALKPCFAYTGLYRIVRRLIFALKNGSYENQLAKYVKQPYRAEWYDKEPYSYIKD
jgi:nitrogenase molybdenum-iron protein alpha chain